MELEPKRVGIIDPRDLRWEGFTDDHFSSFRHSGPENMHSHLTELQVARLAGLGHGLDKPSSSNCGDCAYKYQSCLP